MITASAILSRAEADQERLAAIFRVVVFLALLATVLSLRQQGAHHHPILAVASAYGGLAVTGLLLAWLGIFHPSLPYIFATIEVSLLVAQTTLMADLMGRSPSMLATVPMAMIVFVLLAHAAMRYRPWLIVYTAGIFLTGLFVAISMMPGEQTGVGTGYADKHDVVHHQALPFAVLVLTALILFVTGRGTRRILRSSIEERIGRTRLSRFFAPDIADQLVSVHDAGLTQGRVRPVVVLFADIRGFSALAEQMDPGDLCSFLTEFREILAKTILDHGGVVDKFIGDAVMAVFGFPEENNSPPNRAFRCALAARARIAVWSREKMDAGLPQVEVGIGLHAGDAFVGVIGRESLLEFTVIGDTVNVAERMERLTRELDADIAISDRMAQKVALTRDSGWILARSCLLAGRSRPVDVYYLPRNHRHSGDNAGKRLKKGVTVPTSDYAA